MSSGNEPQERRRTTRLETIGGLSEIQRKLAIHPSASKYYAMDRETERMGAVHLQMTFPLIRFDWSTTNNIMAAPGIIGPKLLSLFSNSMSAAIFGSLFARFLATCAEFFRGVPR